MTARPMMPLALATFVICAITYGTASAWLSTAVALSQVAAVAWLAAGRLSIRFRAVIMAIAVSLGVLLLQLGLTSHSLEISAGGFCHAAVYTALLIWFGGSLGAGREPLVTGFARRLRTGMPDNVIRYTRRVTVAWCVFFTAQIATSLGLLLAAPASAWSAFVHLWNLPLVAVMILAEFSCRSYLFRREERTGLLATLTGLRHIHPSPRVGQ